MKKLIRENWDFIERRRWYKTEIDKNKMKNEGEDWNDGI